MEMRCQEVVCTHCTETISNQPNILSKLTDKDSQLTGDRGVETGTTRKKSS